VALDEAGPSVLPERFGPFVAGDCGRNEWAGIVPGDVDRGPTFQDLDEHRKEP